jgi:hypothetical protein
LRLPSEDEQTRADPTANLIFSGSEISSFVMAGLVPAIHVSCHPGKKDVDARDKPGHDELNNDFRRCYFI